MTPSVVTRPILSTNSSANHSAPSGPTVIPDGLLLGVGVRNSFTTPSGVMRPIRSSPHVNQTLPSGPQVMSFGPGASDGKGNRRMGPVEAAAREESRAHP
jgi:hypothetical protein